MKLSAIASAFKKNKYLKILYDSKGHQWISDGAAYYLITGMPKLTAPNVLKIFDVPEDKQDEWNCVTEKMSDYIEHLCLDDHSTLETPIDIMELEMTWQGKNICFFRYNNTILAINEKYLKPLNNAADYLRFFARETMDGKYTVITCHNGLELKAVICPVNLSDKMLDEMRNISMLYCCARIEHEESDQENDDDSEFEQGTL